MHRVSKRASGLSCPPAGRRRATPRRGEHTTTTLARSRRRGPSLLRPRRASQPRTSAFASRLECCRVRCRASPLNPPCKPISACSSLSARPCLLQSRTSASASRTAAAHAATPAHQLSRQPTRMLQRASPSNPPPELIPACCLLQSRTLASASRQPPHMLPRQLNSSSRAHTGCCACCPIADARSRVNTAVHTAYVRGRTLARTHSLLCTPPMFADAPAH